MSATETASDRTAKGLARFHPSALDERSLILQLFEKARDERVPLRGARTRNDDSVTAYVVEVSGHHLLLNWDHPQSKLLESTQLLFSFAVSGTPYCFYVSEILDQNSKTIRIRTPAHIFRTERRERARRDLDTSSSSRVSLARSDGVSIEGRIQDSSPDGLGVDVPASTAGAIGAGLTLRFLDGALAGQERWARLCRVEEDANKTGWVRLGLATTAVRPAPPAPIDERVSIVSATRSETIRQHASLLWGALRIAAARTRARVSSKRGTLPHLDLVSYKNEKGEELKAIVDSYGSPNEATAVVIPPAWGRTKETLLPLAQTVVATFRRARSPVIVIRFDGVRRRGESYTDAACRTPGRESLNFTISDAVSDISATVKFLSESRDWRPERTVLVTFSAASIEGRHALYLDQGRHLHGWVSVVGSPDLQSGLRAVSGGLDYIGAAERGVLFGIQELMGVSVDMDRISEDALANRIAFLEDAKTEIEKIPVPITWIHGKHDAWLDLMRVREIMSCGPKSARRLIEVPTGHQLRDSKEALQVFQLVSCEIARIAIGRNVRPSLPDLAGLEARRIAERQRLKSKPVDIQSLWRDYLIGRDGALGIELMNATSSYRAFMGAQIKLLALKGGDTVGDFGAGIGPFPFQIGATGECVAPITIDEIDYVREGLVHARDRLANAFPNRNLTTRYLACDLNLSDAEGGLPIAENSYDAILASLLLSYVRNPKELLRQFRAILRPDGRLVVSALKRDADISKLYVEGVSELRGGWGESFLRDHHADVLEKSFSSFLNDAARLLDLEEAGTFTFWDTGELERMVREVGFAEIRVGESFGDPPQAIVLSARRS